MFTFEAHQNLLTRGRTVLSYIGGCLCTVFPFALTPSTSRLFSCILVLLFFVGGGPKMRPNCFCSGDNPCCLS